MKWDDSIEGDSCQFSSRFIESFRDEKGEANDLFTIVFRGGKYFMEVFISGPDLEQLLVLE